MQADQIAEIFLNLQEMAKSECPACIYHYLQKLNGVELSYQLFEEVQSYIGKCSNYCENCAMAHELCEEQGDLRKQLDEVLEDRLRLQGRLNAIEQDLSQSKLELLKTSSTQQKEDFIVEEIERKFREKNSFLEAQLSKLELKNQKLEAENVNLSTELDKSKADAQRLQAQNYSLFMQNSQYQSYLDMTAHLSQTQKYDVETVQEQLLQATIEVNKLKLDNNNLKIVCQKQKTEYEKFEQKAKCELDRLGHELEMYSQEHDKEMQECRLDKLLAERESKRFLERCQRMERDMQSYREQSAQLMTEKQQADSDFKMTYSQLYDAKTELEVQKYLQQNYTSLSANLELKNKEIQRLRDRLQYEGEKNEKCAGFIRDVKITLSDLKAEKENAEQACGALRENKANLQQQIGELEEKLQRREKELDEQKAELYKMQDRLNRYNADIVQRVAQLVEEKFQPQNNASAELYGVFPPASAVPPKEATPYQSVVQKNETGVAEPFTAMSPLPVDYSEPANGQ